MINPIFWIIYLSLVFWTIYQKWDEHKDKYTAHSVLTISYFIIASLIISVFFPFIFNFFSFDKIGIVLVTAVLVLTYAVYEVLNKIKKKKIEWPFFDYFQLLDKRYILPKFAEIIFQQTFFVSIFIISLNSFGQTTTLVLTTLAFVLAHVNLFLFRSLKEAVFYFLFAMIGAPVFVLLVLGTEVIWYSLALHMMFYTALSIIAWIWNVIRE